MSGEPLPQVVSVCVGNRAASHVALGSNREGGHRTVAGLSREQRGAPGTDRLPVRPMMTERPLQPGVVLDLPGAPLMMTHRDAEEYGSSHPEGKTPPISREKRCSWCCGPDISYIPYGPPGGGNRYFPHN